MPSSEPELDHDDYVLVGSAAIVLLAVLGIIGVLAYRHIEAVIVIVGAVAASAAIIVGFLSTSWIIGWTLTTGQARFRGKLAEWRN